MKNVEEMLRVSKIVAGGFLGDDKRPLQEIVEADVSELAQLDHTVHDIAERMRQITALAEAGLGSWVGIDDDIEAATTDTRGMLTCPWPHPGVFPKTVVTVRSKSSGKTVCWSALNIHLIEKHSFFEGKGAQFRLEPRELVSVLF
jgi:hypothetical protein